MTFIDQNGEHKSVQGKVGDNVMYLAHRHNVEIEGTYCYVRNVIFDNKHIQ